jgi:hypothetical protein
VAFARDGQHLLGNIAETGFLESDVFKERMNRRQANIATPWRIAAVLFQVVEKTSYERSIQFLDGQHRGRLMQVLLGKFQQ